MRYARDQSRTAPHQDPHRQPLRDRPMAVRIDRGPKCNRQFSRFRSSRPAGRGGARIRARDCGPSDGDAGNAEALIAIEPLLADASALVRLRAVAALAEFGAVADMVPPVTKLITDDPNPIVRRLAVQALFLIRDNPGAVVALGAALDDSDQRVRDAARKILSDGRP